MTTSERHVLITGGSRGIGQALVEAFRENGDRVSTCSRAGGDTQNDRVLHLACDVTDKDAVQDFISKAVAAHGPVDVLVNNAGITRDGSMVLMAETDWHAVMKTNLDGAFRFSQKVAFPMMKQGHGVIINMSSVAGVTGNAGQANYSAAKGALNSLTRTMAKELGRSGIRVNAIAPGFIETDMTVAMSESDRKAALRSISLRRLGMPQDIAAVALFLAGPGGAYITGQVIRVDGGMVL